MSTAIKAEQQQLTDPVCGMKVSSESERYFDHRQERYHFCCDNCSKKFSARPEIYLNKRQPAADELVDESATYTRPMHLESQYVYPDRTGASRASLFSFVALVLPMIAAAAMSFISVSVITNSLRLRNVTL